MSNDRGLLEERVIRLVIVSGLFLASHNGSAEPESTPSPEAIDPGNELLWRTRLRRLESEVVRDAILTVSGDRNLTMGGPPVPISTRPDGLVEVAKDQLSIPGDAYKRSIYLTTRRAYNAALLTVFDQPLVATNCVRRSTSAVPLQSLFMLNDAFVAEQAEHFARRVERARQACPMIGFTAHFDWRWLVFPPRANGKPAANCCEGRRSSGSQGARRGTRPRIRLSSSFVSLC